MPQLSLFVDEETLDRIESQAKVSKTSASKYAAAVLRKYFFNSWPESFKDSFGSITDDSFNVPHEPDAVLDAYRESL